MKQIDLWRIIRLRTIKRIMVNKEGKYVMKTECKFCKYKEHSPKCMWQIKQKCSHFKPKGK